MGGTLMGTAVLYAKSCAVPSGSQSHVLLENFVISSDELPSHKMPKFRSRFSSQPCLMAGGKYNDWLAVSNMNFMFHFIYGMSSFPLTNIFQDG